MKVDFEFHPVVLIRFAGRRFCVTNDALVFVVGSITRPRLDPGAANAMPWRFLFLINIAVRIGNVAQYDRWGKKRKKPGLIPYGAAVVVSD